METKLILFNPFGHRPEKKPIMLEVINFGKFDGEALHYTTRQGLQVKSIPEIEMGRETRVVNLTDIDYRDSLHWWFKQYPKESGKEVVLDTTLTSGLEYKGNCWHFGLFIQVTDEKIYVNPNLSLD